MLTEIQISELRKALASSRNPLFFHDGDADGLCAFLLLYRLHHAGRNIIVASTSRLGKEFLRQVGERNPDSIFILDIPIVEQDFLDGVNCPVFWLDHHQPQQRSKVHYYNPLLTNPEDYIPTTYLAWQVSGNLEDIWIAAAGCLADYSLPDFLGQFRECYPSLLPPGELPGRADLSALVFASPLSTLIKFFFFIQKGPGREVRESIKVLTRIRSPDEILQQTTPQGKYLYKRFQRINVKYQALLTHARGLVSRSRLLLFTYTEQQWSFTANLSNELAALYPQKIILIARKKSGEMKCSLRGKNIRPILQKALEGIEGHGGGHPDACGAVIKERDWEIFLGQLKAQMQTGEQMQSGEQMQLKGQKQSEEQT